MVALVVLLPPGGGAVLMQMFVPLQLLMLTLLTRVTSTCFHNYYCLLWLLDVGVVIVIFPESAKIIGALVEAL